MLQNMAPSHFLDFHYLKEGSNLLMFNFVASKS